MTIALQKRVRWPTRAAADGERTAVDRALEGLSLHMHRARWHEDESRWDTGQVGTHWTEGLRAAAVGVCRAHGVGT